MGPSWLWACVPEALDQLIPHIGSSMVLFVRGGFSVNQSSLTRFYSIHTFVLPLVTLILVIIHFSMLRKQGQNMFISWFKGKYFQL